MLSLSLGLVAAAVLYDGEATADADLDDSGVWVTKSSAALVGRFNTEAKALDGTLLAGSADFDVDQQASQVLVADDGTSTANLVDVARLKFSSGTSVPAGAELSLGGGRVAVLDDESGFLWVRSVELLPGLDVEKDEPTLELGDEAQVVTSQEGTVYAVVPSTDMLWTVRPGEKPEHATLELLDEGDDVVLTTVGDDLVILDRSSGEMRLPGGDVVDVADAQGARLQHPGQDSAMVAYATGSALVRQPLDGGAQVSRRATGVPAAPVQLGGCLYGAWSTSGQIVRDCEGTDRDVDRVLEGIDDRTQLEYRTNRDAVVLNDLSAGTVWMALDEYEKVDDWDVQLPAEGDGEDENADDDTPELVDQTVVDREKQDPPEAKDDSFGVRAGRSTVLDVLANDLDPDGDVITAELGDDAPTEMAIQSVVGGRALQAVVPDDATGKVTFGYTVTDGRGGEDDATVDVRVVPWAENSGPEATGEPVLKVGLGRSAEIRVLPFFRDPEGDDLYLATATSTSKGDEVRATPDGRIEFRDEGTATGRKKVTLTVSDGRATTEGTLWVDVVGDTQEAPIAVGDHVVVTAGEPVTVKPLKNDSDPNGDELRLADVSEAKPAEITENVEAGTFTFVATEARSYDVLYRVTDGPSATTGVVRVDVVDPDDAKGPPVAVSDTALLPAGGSVLVDVLANDSDPAGGVLVVQSVDVPDDAGVTVATLGHQMLRITETRRLAEPVTLTYTVSNGDDTATGEVRVLPVPAPDRLRPPNAVADEVVVHAGDYVNIPVLANDSHPDGLELTLDDELEQTVEAGQGDLFVSEGRLRFRAGAEATTAYAIYKVQDPNGQEDSAQVTIHVRDGEKNRAPMPGDVQARVLSGGKVRVQVPLDGIDPDGDSVQLVNIVQPPVKGIAEIAEGQYIDFRSTAGATGQDTLKYAVVDSRGETATGTVRIGISPPSAENHPPVAADDIVTARPDRMVSVPALRNDSDADGDQIGLVPGAIEATKPLDPEVVEDRIVLQTPSDEGTSSFYYGIEDVWAARATGTVTLEVSADAPLLPPIARDDIVAPAEVTPQMTSLTVPVLRNDEDPDGAATELTVEVEGSTATVGDEGEVKVRLTDARQILTYTVTDVDGLVGKAFLQVPASKKLETPQAEQPEEEEDELLGPPPLLKSSFVPLEVISGEPLTVDLRNAVTVAEGGKVAIADAGSARAVAGSVVVRDAQHLVYTSTPDYVGPAAVSVQVTDGLGEKKDAAQRVVTVQVPITVLPPENLPPTPGTPTASVAAGEESTVDLSRFATDVDDDPLTFSMGAAPEGLTLGQSGGVVTLQASPDVVKGTGFDLAYTVSDGENPAVDGVLRVTVVASTRPLAKANPDTVPDAHQGKPVSVPVLANDVDPFDPKGLELVGISVETGVGDAVIEGDSVVITPEQSFVGTLVAVYRLQDATQDVDRQVEGRINVNVLGVPEAPAKPVVEEVRSKTVVLSWTPPLNNGAEITGYTVTSSMGDTFECTTTTCTLDGLTNNVTYTFTVTATNAVGESKSSVASAEARPDEKPNPPAAPTLAFGDKSLKVTWVNATYTDRSPIECVNLMISPPPASGVAQVSCVTGQTFEWEGLTNGTAYTVALQAVNAAPDPSEWGEASAPETPAGPPAAPAAPRATRIDDPLGGRIRVTWDAPNANGDAIKKYYVTNVKDGTVVEVTGTSWDATGLNNEASYSFTVVAENKAGPGKPSPASNAVTPFGRPEAPTGVTARDAAGDAVVRWNAADANGAPVSSYTVTASAGGSLTVSGTSATFTGLPDGATSTFTVTATNAGGTSGKSAASNGVKTYSKPGAPNVTWTKTSATDGYFTVTAPNSWNGDKGTVKWSLSGSENRSGEGTGRIAVSGGYSKSYTVTTSATNGAGTTNGGRASGSTDAPPQPKVWTSDSGIVYKVSGCSTNKCTRVQVHANADFPSGTYNFRCWNNFGGTNSNFSTQSAYLQAGGSANLYCVVGVMNGAQVWVTVDGKDWTFEKRAWPR
ncbi:fibronectin type III domain-containing protein [Isoptericola sp. NEAU-Y5]|uniref:Fibronectin type III domain-containing protein n=1 Tax=Isoptericola luteus TaxID=2879484 RepID=A0ABS7ZJ62_9MICO|nr:Ig-like domain-containing protein [Isoptericola sp. NEAU-Y5]MCA5895060.1 fibronectin type III domain-containing protein [Isoptericola sp. NEAU-Y5]